MNRVYEGIRMEPLLLSFGTAANTAINKINVKGNADFSVIVGCHAGASAITNATIVDLFSATAVAAVQFSITEATAASANGSVITGATLTLGAATVGTLRGAVCGLIDVSSDIGTAISVTINGVVYRTTAVGATALSGAAKLANAINGSGTSVPLPHYRAITAFLGATDSVSIEPSDEMGTGLTIETTAAGSGIRPFPRFLQGVIDVAGHRLSTNTPKYIGVNVSTHAMTTAVEYAFLVRKPKHKPAFVGSIMDVTT
jgi:hypothetical protein